MVVSRIFHTLRNRLAYGSQLMSMWIGYTKLYRKDKVMVFLKRRGEGGNHDPKKSKERVQ